MFWFVFPRDRQLNIYIILQQAFYRFDRSTSQCQGGWVVRQNLYFFTEFIEDLINSTMSEQSVPEKVNGVVYACIKTLYTLSEGKEIQFTVIPSLTIHPKIQQKPRNIS